MMNDNRRYLPRNPRNKEEPIKPSGGGDMLRDGYTIHRREPFERKEDPYRWSKARNASPNLKTDDDCLYDSIFDSYDKD